MTSIAIGLAGVAVGSGADVAVAVGSTVGVVWEPQAESSRVSTSRKMTRIRRTMILQSIIRYCTRLKQKAGMGHDPSPRWGIT